MRLFERVSSKFSGGVSAKKKEDMLSTVFLYLKRNDFSTIPVILQKITLLARDQSVGAEEYAKVCEMDQSSCMRMLRMANSVYFGTRDGRVIRTIKDAIVRLGFEKAREVIESSVVSAFFKSADTIGAYSTSALWLNSVAVASCARLIYEICPSLSRPVMDPYLSGLLRNIGIPLMHLCFLEDGFKDAVSASQAGKTLLHDEEIAHLGLGHQETGLAVARKWLLHDELNAVIGNHHDMKVDDEPARTLIHVVRVSEWIAFELQLGYSDFCEAQVDSYAESLGALHLDESSYERVKKDLTTELEQDKNLGWFAGRVL